MTVRAYHARMPEIASNAFVADTAMVVGYVTLGARASVWYGTVLRAEEQPVIIGEDSNIQDNSVVHVINERIGTRVGARVTAGHRVILHGCTIGDLCLVGMGSVVLDDVEVGAETIIGAGSVVTPGTKIPGGVLALGAPCRVKRPLTPSELDSLRESADRYVQLAREHRVLK
jgi:carbonic anhydrase/acetyltransferase-like protein (isoleucine patch superfamily)